MPKILTKFCTEWAIESPKFEKKFVRTQHFGNIFFPKLLKGSWCINPLFPRFCWDRKENRSRKVWLLFYLKNRTEMQWTEENKCDNLSTKYSSMVQRSKKAVLMMGVLTSAWYVSWTTEYKDVKATQKTKN